LTLKDRSRSSIVIEKTSIFNIASKQRLRLHDHVELALSREREWMEVSSLEISVAAVSRAARPARSNKWDKRQVRNARKRSLKARNTFL
jgi:hypothetical protein